MLALRNTLKHTLLVGMAVVGYLLVLAWNEDYGDASSERISHSPAALEVRDNGGDGEGFLNAESNAPVSPDIPSQTREEIQTSNSNTASVDRSSEQSAIVSVLLDHMIVDIDRVGGDIVGVRLPSYPLTLGGDQPFSLLDRSSKLYYVAQSGFAGADGVDARGRPTYELSTNSLKMEEGQSELRVRLAHVDETGVVYNKIFTFKRDQYDVGVRFTVDNNADRAWKGTVFAQIKRDETPDGSGLALGQTTFLGGAYYKDADEPYNKLALDEMSSGALNERIEGGWIAFIQHYFMSAWIPDEAQVYDYRTDHVNNQFRILGFQTALRTVPSGENTAWDMTFYAGPKEKGALRELAPGLEYGVDYGPLFFLSEFFFDVLNILVNGVWGISGIGNWGFAIVLLTLMIKGALWPLSAKAYRSMAHMRRLQPQMMQIKERYGDDRQMMSQKMMEMYKTEKINPLGGCLPMLAQMPIFLAFYWMLLESVELRQAPFFAWIQDLSVKDPYFILPILMGASMFLQQKLSPTPPDPMQANVMRIMPIMLSLLFMFFPSGVVLYWLCSNLISIGQQWYITRSVEAASGRAS